MRTPVYALVIFGTVVTFAVVATAMFGFMRPLPAALVGVSIYVVGTAFFLKKYQASATPAESKSRSAATLRLIALYVVAMVIAAVSAWEEGWNLGDTAGMVVGLILVSVLLAVYRSSTKQHRDPDG